MITETPVTNDDGTVIGYVVDHGANADGDRYEACRPVTDDNPDGWLKHDPFVGYSAWHASGAAAAAAVRADAAKDD